VSVNNLLSPQGGVCGRDEKSDCIAEIYAFDHLEIKIHSKVEKFFKEQIENTIKTVLKENGIKTAKVILKDNGALDWVIKARLECAIRRAT